jgi:hypothetical protein
MHGCLNVRVLLLHINESNIELHRHLGWMGCDTECERTVHYIPRHCGISRRGNNPMLACVDSTKAVQVPGHV